MLQAAARCHSYPWREFVARSRLVATNYSNGNENEQTNQRHATPRHQWVTISRWGSGGGFVRKWPVTPMH